MNRFKYKSLVQDLKLPLMYVLVALHGFGPEVICENVWTQKMINYFYMFLSCFGK
jgi:hypothetical protein